MPVGTIGRNPSGYERRPMVTLASALTHGTTPSATLSLVGRNTNITTEVAQQAFWAKTLPPRKGRVWVTPSTSCTMAGAVQKSSDSSNWSTLVTFSGAGAVTAEVDLPKYLRVSITTHASNTAGSVTAYLEV